MDTRNVQLTLEKAREWYQKGGELKEVALQAFKEEELKDSKPRSWEGYCELQKIKHAKGYFMDSDSVTHEANWDDLNRPRLWKNVLSSVELVKKFRAYMQLISLREEWIGNWEPDWEDDRSMKYIINTVGGDNEINSYHRIASPLSFPTYEMAKDFMECFKELLEEAKGLY